LIDVDDAADLFLRLGAADPLQLIGGFDLRDPHAQVLFCHFRSDCARAADDHLKAPPGRM
jgi:hypothetical protein